MTEKEYIDKRKLKPLFDERFYTAFMQEKTRENPEFWRGVCAGVNWGLNTILDAPAADVVDVVRCKDCKNAYINSFSAQSGVAVCRFLANRSNGELAIVQQDDFCSYGERKEQDNV